MNCVLVEQAARTMCKIGSFEGSCSVSRLNDDIRKDQRWRLILVGRQIFLGILYCSIAVVKTRKGLVAALVAAFQQSDDARMENLHDLRRHTWTTAAGSAHPTWV